MHIGSNYKILTMNLEVYRIEAIDALHSMKSARIPF